MNIDSFSSERSTRPQRAVGSEAASKDAASAVSRAIVYVDGFNVYNRLLVNTPYKWLDLRALASRLLDPRDTIVAINYYTSRVSGKADPLQPKRQNDYLRALQGHIPELNVYLGKFVHAIGLRPLARPRVDGRLHYVNVRNTQEKGSDVNIAAHLVRDAFLNAFDVALVISQDTDLVEPIRIAVQDAGRIVGAACPERIPEKIKQHASFARHIHKNILRDCQLPAVVTAPSGKAVGMPAVWAHPHERAAAASI